MTAFAMGKPMIKQLTAIMCLLTMAACASAPLPQKDREITFIEQTSLKQKDAYNAVLSYLAKNLNNSNGAIQVKDPEAGHLISQITFECNELRAFMDLTKHEAQFNVDVSTKDNKVRLVYEALTDSVTNIDGKPIGSRSIASADQMSALKTCAEKNKTEIMGTLASKKDDNW